MNLLKILPTAICICATYVYFLIFAQFAFLAMVRAHGVNLDLVMGVMGLSGLFASFLTIVLHRHISLRAAIYLGLLLCGYAGGFSVFCSEIVGFAATAMLIGTGLAILTVSLATRLTQMISPSNIGLCVGLGTGFAYFICNIPWLFRAQPNFQALLAVSFCMLGVIGNRRTSSSQLASTHSSENNRSFKGLGFILVVITFLAIIWLDSAMFFLIQNSQTYKALTWQGSGNLWRNAAIHLIFSLMAGYAIDRGFWRPILPMAFGLLALGTACLLGPFSTLAAPLYVAGVSMYSVVLVAFPSLARAGEDSLSRSTMAAWIYGVAGWFGSAMGIGMAKDLDRIPVSFLIIAGLVVLVCGLAHTGQPKLWRGLVFSSLIGGLFFLVGMTTERETTRVLPQTPEARGRNIYIREGCINCHSQYVRPGTGDDLRWGPVVDVETLRRMEPPLFGNRRQGPDLLNVGNRRSIAWLSQKLSDPQSLNQGSRMPAFDFLFDQQDGDDLVAYLKSLGSQTLASRIQTIYQWRPNRREPAVSLETAGILFRRACASCHGKNGTGDGPLAPIFSNNVRDLVSDHFKFTSGPEDVIGLARIIKFGQPGTSMPGHEYLTDGQVLGLVRYLDMIRHPRVGE